MAFKKIGQRTVPLTAELAKQFSEMKRWEGERPYSPSRVNYHLNEMSAGRFYDPTWYVAHIKGRSEPVRVNGQHTSAAACQANGQLPAGLCVTIVDFECDTEEDAAALFNTIDSPKSSRSPVNSIGALSVGLKGLNRDAVSSSTLYRAASGIAIAMSDGVIKKLSTPDRFRYLTKRVDYINAASLFLKHRYCCLAGVCGAVYETWRVWPADLALMETTWGRFWTAVMSKTPDGSAAGTLNMYLRDTLRSNKRNDGVRAVYVKCLHAWNAYINRTSTRLAYYPNAEVPDTLYYP